MAGTCDVKAEALIGAEHRVRTGDLRLGRRNALPVSHETGRKRQLGSGGPFRQASTNASTSDRATLIALSTRACRSSPRSQSL